MKFIVTQLVHYQIEIEADDGEQAIDRAICIPFEDSRFIVVQGEACAVKCNNTSSQA